MNRENRLLRPFAIALLLSACSGDGGAADTTNGGSPSSAGSPGASGNSSSGGAPINSGGTPSAAGAASGTAGSSGSAAGGAVVGGAGGAPSSAGSGGAVSGGVGGSLAGAGGNTNAGAGGASAGAGGGSGGSGGSASGAGPIGFATLNGGTTGGKAGQTVTASTFAELKQYAESATAYVIMISGTISNGANGGSIKVKSNKSLIGVGGNAFLNGVGLDINNSNNVIVQNLRVSLIGVTTRTETAGVYSGGVIQVNGGDAISISGTSSNIWIDHCELFSEDPAEQTSKDLYDGLLDIKGKTAFITISWCYLHDHHKGGLVGAADDDLNDNRKVTLHHNYYDNVKLRVPMYRGSVGHFFNNYIVGATDATEIRAGTCLRVEKNYYEKLHYSIYTPSDSAGSAERIDNVEVDHASRAYPASCKADIPYDYAKALTATTNDVKTVVPQGAGVGKL